MDVGHVNLDFVLQKAAVKVATGYGEAMEDLMEHLCLVRNEGSRLIWQIEMSRYELVSSPRG